MRLCLSSSLFCTFHFVVQGARCVLVHDDVVPTSGALYRLPLSSISISLSPFLLLSAHCDSLLSSFILYPLVTVLARSYSVLSATLCFLSLLYRPLGISLDLHRREFAVFTSCPSTPWYPVLFFFLLQLPPIVDTLFTLDETIGTSQEEN